MMRHSQRGMEKADGEGKAGTYIARLTANGRIKTAIYFKARKLKEQYSETKPGSNPGARAEARAKACRHSESRARARARARAHQARNLAAG